MQVAASTTIPNAVGKPAVAQGEGILAKSGFQSNRSITPATCRPTVAGNGVMNVETNASTFVRQSIEASGHCIVLLSHSIVRQTGDFATQRPRISDMLRPANWSPRATVDCDKGMTDACLKKQANAAMPTTNDGALP
jgi:hypothetical protein